MVELLRELATLENGLVLGLVAVVGFFLQRWVARVDSELEKHATAEGLRELAAEVVKLEKSVDTASMRAAGAFRNVIHLSKETTERFQRVDRDLEEARDRTAGVETDVERVQEEVDQLQRDVWGGKKS